MEDVFKEIVLKSSRCKFHPESIRLIKARLASLKQDGLAGHALQYIEALEDQIECLSFKAQDGCKPHCPIFVQGNCVTAYENIKTWIANAEESNENISMMVISYQHKFTEDQLQELTNALH